MGEVIGLALRDLERALAPALVEAGGDDGVPHGGEGRAELVPEHREKLVLATVELRELRQPRAEVLFQPHPLRGLGFERARLLLERADDTQPIVLALERGEALGGNDASVFGADLLERVGMRRARERRHGIRAEERQRHPLRERVPELFHARGRVRLSIGGEERDHLAEGAEVLLAMSAGAGDGGAEDVGEAAFVGPAVDHELRERLGGIERVVPSLLAYRRHVDAAAAKPLGERLAVDLGRDHEARAAGPEGGGDEAGDRVEEVAVVVVELDEMLGAGRLATTRRVEGEALSVPHRVSAGFRRCGTGREGSIPSCR